MQFQSGFSLGKTLGHTSLFAIGGVLGNNALGHSLINSAGGLRQQSGVGGTGGHGVLVFFNGGAHRGLHHAVAQTLLLVHLNALNGRFNIRQDLSPPQPYNQQLLF